MPRRTPLLIAFSLVANAALAVVLWQRSTSPAAHSPHSTAASPSPAATAAAQTPDAFSAQWQQLLQNPDDTAALSLLRSSGFPPEVVRSLMTERIRSRYQDRFRALAAKQAETPYWRTNAWYNFDGDVATRSERRALEREISDSVRKLLGDDTDSLSFYERDSRARSFGNLPSVKITELQAISRDYGELSSQIRDNAKGVVLAEDREKLAFLEKEKRTDLSALLTPDELEDYDRRNSPSASEIRGKLRFFDATETEFLALYQAQHDFDARYGRDNLSGEQSDLRKAALPQLTEQFKAALGPERYAEYELLTDGNYSSTRSTLTQLGLPADSARELVATQRAANKRAEAIRADKSLNSEQQASQLAALEKDATEKVTATIGAQNLDEYKKYTGNWLTRLAPKPKNPATR
ncbi:hypothetical protein CMV30_04935 [Nibricoccus aquaticus]|uniref:Lipase modulator n=1 Tax=Nibricoccus aquaticus TaxID=2576891 RepID=A0A290Q3V9_9BACT|nr:hypothetical protein [Nibricoccus aquaticus]ATC63349.1 hypothetical protein CMV30_04935 [Nibricoccus aquaticus]